MSYVPLTPDNFKGAKNNIDEALESLYEKGINFDSIAVRGMSGALMGGVIASEYDIPLILVRKKGARSHSRSSVETKSKVKKYIILDDLIESGKTVVEIEKAIDIANGAKCVAIVLYDHQDGNVELDLPNRRAARQWEQSPVSNVPIFTRDGEVEVFGWDRD